MPLDYRKYPENWQELSLHIREKSNWSCSCCGKKCYKPGEIPDNLTRSEWAGAILQTHHKDFNSLNNNLDNLTSLCAACHLNVHKSKISSVSEGQLSLW